MFILFGLSWDIQVSLGLGWIPVLPAMGSKLNVFVSMDQKVSKLLIYFSYCYYFKTAAISNYHPPYHAIF